MLYELNSEQVKNRTATLETLDLVKQHNTTKEQLNALKTTEVWKLLFSDQADWVSKATSLIELGKVSPSLVASLADIYLTKNIVPNTDELYATAFLEENVSVDWSMIETTITSEGDSLVLNGEKWFVANVDATDSFLVLAKDAVNNRLQIVSVTTDTKGIEIEEQMVLGPKNFNFSKVKFNHVNLDQSAVVKTIGTDDKYLVSFDELKIAIAALSSALAERALNNSLAVARNKEEFGQTIGETQNVQFKIAEMTVKINAGKTLLYEAMQKKDRNERSDVDVAMAKLFLSEVANLAVDYNVQINGIHGLEKNNLSSELYLSQRLTELYVSPSEKERDHIAEYVIANEQF